MKINRISGLIILMVLGVVFAKAQPMTFTPDIGQFIRPGYEFIRSAPYRRSLDSLSLKEKGLTSDSEVLFHRALLHYRYGKVNDALEEITRYMEKANQSEMYVGHIVLGRIHFSRLLPSFAVSEFEKAIALSPDVPDAYLEKAFVYAFRGQGQEELDYIMKTLRKFPDQYVLYCYRGIKHLAMNNPKRAIADLKVYLDHPPHDDKGLLATAYFMAARAHIRLKQPDEAMRLVNGGISVNPEIFDGYGIRGEVYFMQGDYQNALSQFKKMETRYQSSEYFLSIAKTHEALGDLKSACAYYQKLCSLNPNTEPCMKVKKLKCFN